MSKEVTRYRNQINSIPMRHWTAEEMNFFFVVLTKMRDEGTRELHMNKYELAELAHYSIEHNQRYHDTIQSLGKKLQSLTYFESTNNSVEMMPFFTKFRATWSEDLSDMSLVLKVNEEFEYILNKWNEGNWTQFMLDEFINIKSTYSKTLFRLLKQWRLQGSREFTVEEFKVLMDIPPSYNTGRIYDRIIKNGMEDLDSHFKNLKVKVIKSNKRGNPVTGYRFTFQPEKSSKVWVQDKYKNSTEYSESIRKNNSESEKVPDKKRQQLAGDNEELKRLIEEFRSG